MVGSSWLVELLECGPMDLVNPGGMGRAYNNTPGVGLIHRISVHGAGIQLCSAHLISGMGISPSGWIGQ